MNFNTREGVRFRKLRANVGNDDDSSELEELDVDRFREEVQEASSDISPCPWEEHGNKECLDVPNFWNYIWDELTRLVLICLFEFFLSTDRTKLTLGFESLSFERKVLICHITHDYNLA